MNTSLLSKPRTAVRYLDRSLKTQLILIALLTISYFILASIFILSIDKVTLAPLLSLKGLLLIIYSLLTIGIGSITAIYASTLAIWIGARCLNGQGSLPETRAAVIWTLVWSIPIGFFLLLIYLTIRRPDHSTFTLLIRVASYLGVLATVVYQTFILLTTLSEVQRFGLSRALASILFAIALFVVMGWMLFSLNS